MAKQESLIKVRGKIGDLSFTKHSSRGYEVRQKGGVDRNRILNDPNFQRTRENMQEFGTAASKAKQLRQQLNNVSRGVADKTMGNRLTSLMHRIQKADVDSSRGERMFKDANSNLLKGFEFNQNSSLKMLFAQDLTPVYDRASGTVTVDIPTFNPQIDVLLLQSATHLQFVLAAAQLGNDEILPRPIVQASNYVPLVGQFAGESISVALPAALAEVVYIMVGISMYQEVNGSNYPLNNGLYNALTIVHVDVPV